MHSSIMSYRKCLEIDNLNMAFLVVLLMRNARLSKVEGEFDVLDETEFGVLISLLPLLEEYLSSSKSIPNSASTSFSHINSSGVSVLAGVVAVVSPEHIDSTPELLGQLSIALSGNGVSQTSEMLGHAG